MIFSSAVSNLRLQGKKRKIKKKKKINNLTEFIFLALPGVAVTGRLPDHTTRAATQSRERRTTGDSHGKTHAWDRYGR